MATRGRGLVDITGDVERWVGDQDVTTGLVTLFCRHTSASLLIQENADPAVQHDLLAFFERLAPEAEGRYQHATEGADDMPAHIRAALTQSQLAVPLVAGQLVLGTWQGIYLLEHRRQPHDREVVLHIIGS